MNEDIGAIRTAMRAAGAGFRMAEPFPHFVVQLGGLEDGPAILKEVADAFPPETDPKWRRLGHDHVANKFHIGNVASLSAPLRMTIGFLNSPGFIGDLAAITGFKKLIGDPNHYGGGLHMILPGGRLDVHVDFNYHTTLRAHRRLNLLLYLNEDWRWPWGGELELWRDPDDSGPAVSIWPNMGTMVVFETSERSWHGHPKPLECPPGVARKSIALYYYEPGDPPVRQHSTVYAR